jgi:DNA adenine methylase
MKVGSLESSPEARPFLRWAGSKRQILSRLAGYYPSSSPRYIEPFMGSAALFFRLGPRTAVLGDLNGELVETFIAVRDQPEQVFWHLCEYLPSKELYYHLRSIHPEQLSLARRAARFIFLNRYCFNGLYRTNLQGRFNVPFGSGRTGQLPSREELSRASAALQLTSLIEGDFRATTHDVRPGDFVYLDPPYAVEGKRVFRQYGPKAFGANDLVSLASCLDTIDRRGAFFVMTYADCREVRLLCRKWKLRKSIVQRNISGFSKNRRKATELIITNTARCQCYGLT